MPRPESHFIKPDPDIRQEQDDLLLSFLNADCLSTDASPWPTTAADPPSPPYSTLSPDSPTNHTLMDTHQDGPCVEHNAEYMSWLPVGFPTDPYAKYPQTQEACVSPSVLDPSACPLGHYTANGMDDERLKRKRRRKPSQLDAEVASLARQPPKPLALLLPATAATAACHTRAVSTPTPDAVAPSNTVLVKAENQSSSPPSDSGRTGGPWTAKLTCLTESEQSQKAAQLAKRQQRLIKNRAAALLSRKRKREHLNALEEQAGILTAENEQLKSRVQVLEAQVTALKQENSDLERRLGDEQEHLSSQPKATSGVMLVIILLSFALILRTSTSHHALTADDSSKGLALMNAARSVFSYCDQQDDHSQSASEETSSVDDLRVPSSSDLVVVDHIQPGDLQSWFQEKLQHAREKIAKDSILGFSPSHLPSRPSDKRPHIFLYAPTLSQVAPVDQSSVITTEQVDELPVVALVSSLGSSTPSTNNRCQHQYLQTDVQVLHSRIVDGQLFARDPNNATLLGLDPGESSPCSITLGQR